MSGGAAGGVAGGFFGNVAILKRAQVTETVVGTVTSTVTQTTTSTTTKVSTAFATSTTIASNGLAYKKYTHAFDARTPECNFTSSFFQRRTPDAEGVLTNLNFVTPNWPSPADTSLTIPGLLPAAGAFDASQTAFVVQGFFLARTPGSYTFSSPKDKIDNWGYLWLGEPAYCDWTDANAAFKATRTVDSIVSGTTTIELQAGDAIPLTWLWANGGAASRSYLSITLPDGTVVEDTTGLFVQACNPDVFI